MAKVNVAASACGSDKLNNPLLLSTGSENGFESNWEDRFATPHPCRQRFEGDWLLVRQAGKNRSRSADYGLISTVPIFMPVRSPTLVQSDRLGYAFKKSDMNADHSPGGIVKHASEPLSVFQPL